MNRKTILSSVVCCMALNGVNKVMAMEYGINRNASFLEQETETVESMYIIENTVLKKGMSEMALDICELNPQEEVEVISKEGMWARVKVKDEVGYVKLSKLRKSQTHAVDKYLECLSYVTVYKDMTGSSDSQIGKIHSNEKISVLEEMGSYIKIKWNGEEAYIKNRMNYLVDKKKRFSLNGAKIYNSLDKSKFKVLKENTVLTIEGESNNYYKVSYDGGLGYIKKEDVRDIKYVKGSIMTPVKLHVEKSEYSDVRAYITPGSEVEIIENGEQYIKVKYGEYEGYILYSELSVEDTELRSFKEFANEKEDVYLVNALVERSLVEDRYNEIIAKYKKDEVRQASEVEKLLNEFGIIKKLSSEIKVMSNKGKYLEVLVGEDVYYMDNLGERVKKNTLATGYIEVYPKITTTVKTRYIDNSEVNVYLDENKKVSLGVLVEDAQVEFIEDVNKTTSKIKLNDSYVYVDKDCLDKEKMYVTVKEKRVAEKTGKSHKEYVEAISKYLNVFVGYDGSRNATNEEIAYYSNPRNRSVKDDTYKYQYLRLDKFRMVDANVIDSYLNALEGKDGKNIFKDKASVFIEAAKKYNIDPLYLIAHTMLETGYGTSNLARGQVYEPANVTVYNFFGIGAVDSNPLEGGKKTAYENGWTTIDNTIEGSAKWLALNYIHSKENNQNTLYKMRYNYMTRSHQYASDIMWASKIAVIMEKLKDAYIDTTLEFEVPIYNKGSYIKGESESKVIDEEVASNEDSPLSGEGPQKDDKLDKPIIDEKPVTEKPPINKPVIEKPSINKPTLEKPSINKPTLEKPGEKPEVEEDKPSIEEDDSKNESDKIENESNIDNNKEEGEKDNGDEENI